jgi:cytochrome c556
LPTSVRIPAFSLRRARTALPFLALCLLAGCSETVEDTHPQRWVSQRQAIFKDFTRTLEPMGLMARERQAFDAAAFTRAAQALQQRSRDPWALFPADSNYAPTKALPAVWARPAEFERAQQAFTESVQRLSQAAQAGSLAAVQPAVDDVQRRCKACHDQFRQP